MSVSSLSSTRDPIAPLSSPPRRRRQRHRRDDHEGGSSSPESSPIHRYDHRTHSDNDRDANGDDRHNHIISPITAMKSSLKPLDTGDNTNTSNNEQVNASKKEKKRHGQFSQWWIISSFIIINHILAVPIILFYHHMPWQIFAWCGLTAWLALTGVTAGYHRLWSHRSYRAKLPLRIFLATIGTISFQGSIKWWVLRHRIHHRFTDTEEDPYSVIKGLWHAHIGWLLEKPKTYEKMDVIDMSDLNRDPVVEWQIKLIGYGYVLLGLIVPGMIGHYYGDMLGGIAWIGIMARILSWNGIWATNSIAHWYGDRPYDDQSTARGSFITAVICNGEGNHNYHHEFPKDYRHGVKWYEWDPTKWCIWLWYQMGQAYNLHRCHPHSIKHAELKVKENSAHRLLTELRRQRMTLASWGQPAELPVISDAEFLRRVRDEGKFLIKVDGYALDVGDFFQSKHPGGPKPLLQYRGRDATAAFHGVLNKHTQAAQHLAIMFRVARVQPEPRTSISSSS